MKSILLICFLLVSVQAFADQTLNGRQPREWTQAVADKPLENKDYQGDTTAFTNLVSTGHNATGNPGYIALMAWDGTNTNSTAVGNQAFTYYLWVQNGKLVMSSI